MRSINGQPLIINITHVNMYLYVIFIFHILLLPTLTCCHQKTRTGFTSQRKCISNYGTKTGRGTDLPGHRLQVTVEQKEKEPSDGEDVPSSSCVVQSRDLKQLLRVGTPPPRLSITPASVRSAAGPVGSRRDARREHGAPQRRLLLLLLFLQQQQQQGAS